MTLEAAHFVKNRNAAARCRRPSGAKTRRRHITRIFRAPTHKLFGRFHTARGASFKDAPGCLCNQVDSARYSSRKSVAPFLLWGAGEELWGMCLRRPGATRCGRGSSLDVLQIGDSPVGNVISRRTATLRHARRAADAVLLKMGCGQKFLCQQNAIKKARGLFCPCFFVVISPN